MSTTHYYQTIRARALGLVLATGMLTGACGGDDNNNKDPEADSGPAARDSGTRADAGGTTTGDAGRDAGSGSVDNRQDAGPLDPTVPGEMAPTLSPEGGVAYYQDTDLGTRILIRGRDPNGDIASYTMNFLKRNDAGVASPVSFDLDGDQDMPPTPTFTENIVPTPAEAGFFVLFEPTAEFAMAVDTIEVTVKDQGGRVSEKVTATKGPTPMASSSCDPYGFNRCGSTSVCAANTASTFVCTALTAARSGDCSKALELRPNTISKVLGSLRRTSFWDAPSGCLVNNPKRRPDSVVKLRLTADAAKVTLSTDNPGTTIKDTVLYQVASCAGEPVPCTDNGCPGCADDIGGTPTNVRSRLELTGLKANIDYFVVVESLPTAEASGSDYEITVTVE